LRPFRASIRLGYIVQQIGKIKVARIDEFHPGGAFQLQAAEPVETVENASLCA
jgi:hypothetical protein